jgi:HEAT repeat protein
MKPFLRNGIRIMTVVVALLVAYLWTGVPKSRPPAPRPTELATTRWVQALRSPQVEKRRAAVEALAALGSDIKGVVPGLIVALKDKDAGVQLEATTALVRIGQPAVPALRATLNDEQARDGALRTLVQCGPAGVAALTGALKDADEVVRGESARALGGMGTDAAAAVPALIETLKDPDRSVRREAVHALGRIGGDTQTSVPAIVALLKDPWAVNRGEAAIALQRLGPQARAAVPALMANLNDENLDASREAAKALVHIGPAAVPALTGALQQGDEAIRNVAAEILKQIDPKAARVGEPPDSSN